MFYMRQIIIILTLILSANMTAQEFEFGCVDGIEVTITGNYFNSNFKHLGYKNFSVHAPEGWNTDILAVLYGNTNGYGGTSIDKKPIDALTQLTGLWGSEDTQWLFIIEITNGEETKLVYVPFIAVKNN